MSGVTAFAALVRGINVGGKTLKMADLKSICESVGLEDVRTFLQSGNVIFRGRRAPAKIERELEAAIRKTAKLDVRVMVRTHDELARVVEANPFPNEVRDHPSGTIVVFFEKAPSAAAQASLRAAYGGPEPMHFHGREMYVFYAGGMGRSKLTPALYERKLGVAGTARNWNTVTKLVELTRA